MGRQDPTGRSYWDLLSTAQQALEEGNLPLAERSFLLARERREDSPGRVFLTEKISDGLSRLLRGRDKQAAPLGRWTRRARDFQRSFLERGEKVVREAVRLAELRPEDDAEANQPILETALFLVGRSSLFAEEPSSAVPLLKGIFRTAGKSGRPFDVQLIRHDIPLTEEDRLWLARKGPEVLEEFVASEALAPGSADSVAWVHIILQLLHPRYFGSTDRLEEERAWLEAVTTDRMLCRSDDSVKLYRRYLEVKPEPCPRSDEARVRLLELLANVDGLHFPVPRYGEALSALQAAGLAEGSAMSDRFQLALERIEYRRPDPEPGTRGYAWASVGLERDGRVALVYWWQDEPRDLAYWEPGDDITYLAEFLEPCADRLLAVDADVVQVVGNSWPEVPPPWTVHDFATALLEPLLADGGQRERTLLQVGLGEMGPWRRGWRPGLGLEELHPPQRSDMLDSWQSGSGGRSLLGGLLWLGIQARVNRGDPALRAGIGAMAGRGDPAAAFLYGFLVLDEGLARTVDASFEPWTLPLLWTRPDPLGWSAKAESGALMRSEPAEESVRPDLGSNSLAVVTCGDTSGVLAAWGDGEHGGKWRVVLDRLDRLGDLAVIAGQVAGPVTLIPAQGQVHGLLPALEMLNHLLTRQGRPAGRHAGLLPLFHWVRLVETHNGDLLDFQQIRPRPLGEPELYTQYVELLADLPRLAPVLEEEATADPWAMQYAQRVRRAGLVAGLGDCLTLEAGRLDALWGVFEGSGVSWVFLDSAAVHWYLYGLADLGIGDLHALLHSRGERHLSLLTGAMWRRSELEDLLATWLQVYGHPYCLALTDLQPPVLRLADGGVAPDAQLLAVEAHAAGVAQVISSLEQAGGGAVLLPRFGSQARLWRAVAQGELDLGGSGWSFLDPRLSQAAALPGQTAGQVGGLLMVPLLDSLAKEAAPIAQDDTVAAWHRGDEDRRQYLSWRRRLCGLELASLLAGPWDGVEVLDTRWWRLLESASHREEGEAGSAGMPRSGRAALARTCPHGCRLIDLPGAPGRADSSIHPNILEKTRQWLTGQGLVPAPVPAEDQQLPSLPPEGRVLTHHTAEAVWAALDAPLTTLWETGHLDSWLLLVGDQVPPAAAARVAGGFAPGVSVWTPDHGFQDPAPVLWCRGSDLLDVKLQRFLEKHPPWTVLVHDLERWLPSRWSIEPGSPAGAGAGGAGDQGAAALRLLLGCPARRIVLQAGPLTGPWQRYLLAGGGVQLLADGQSLTEGQEPAPAKLLPTLAPVEGAPDLGLDEEPQVSLRRLQHLLAHLRPALLIAEGKDGGPAPAPARDQLVSLRELEVLSGVQYARVEGSVRILRWAARLSGDFLSDAGGKGAERGGEPPAEQRGRATVAARGHCLLVSQRFAEIEHRLLKLQDQVAVLLPLVLGDLDAPATVWLDLDAPPVQFAADELALLDIYLCGVGRRGSPLGLHYLCPRGTLNSRRRVLGMRRSLPEVLADLAAGLSLFRRRLAEVMDAAVETGEGFLVETGLSHLRAEEEEFLALGSAMGLWRWTGPATAGALHLVDLLTLADSTAIRAGSPGWGLLEEELAQAQSAEPRETGTSSPRALPKDPIESGTSGWRGLLGRRDRDAARQVVVKRVAELVLPEGDPDLLVLSGMAGCGRHDALLAGLAQGRAEAGLLGHVTVQAPDAASAAFFMHRWSLCGPDGPMPTVVLADDRGATRAANAPGPTRHLPGQPGAQDVLIMLEIQRFTAEDRYQVAQLGRGRRLIMTLDPAETSEPWEHLFLTVPRAEQVLHLKTQRVLSQRLWSEVRNILPAELTDKVQHQGPGKGVLVDVRADNLDHCLSRLVEAVESGELAPRLRLMGPLTSDLDFLAQGLAERGWLAVRESAWEGLHLPGPREFMAASLVCLAGTMQLGRLQSLLLGSDAQEGQPVRPWRGLLERFLGPESRALVGHWEPMITSLDPGLTVADFLIHLREQPWFASVLADPAARRRASILTDRWGARPLKNLPAEDLWAAWALWIGEQHGVIPSPAAPGEHLPGLPLVLLGPSDQPRGFYLAAGGYLCHGTEPLRRHYPAYSRLSDGLLILYKDRSPLAGAGPEV